MAELLAFTVWSVSCRSRAGASWAIRQNNTFVLHSCHGGGLISSPTLILLVLDCYSCSTKLIFHWFCLLFYFAREDLVCAENSYYLAIACYGDQWTPNDDSVQKTFSVPWPTTCLYWKQWFPMKAKLCIIKRNKLWHQRFEESSGHPCSRVSLCISEYQSSALQLRTPWYSWMWLW